MDKPLRMSGWSNESNRALFEQQMAHDSFDYSLKRRLNTNK